MDEKLSELITGLNDDLKHEYGAAIQYTYSAAVVKGLFRSTLKSFFKDEIDDEMGHAFYLSNKIKALGGTPTTESASIPQPTDLKGLLEASLQAEKDTITRYLERRKQADELELVDLVVKLEDIIADETTHKEELESLLNDKSL